MRFANLYIIYNVQPMRIEELIILFKVQLNAVGLATFSVDLDAQWAISGHKTLSFWVMRKRCDATMAYKKVVPTTAVRP